MPNITGLPLTVKNIFSQPEPVAVPASTLAYLKEGISRWPRTFIYEGQPYTVFIQINDHCGDPVGFLYQNQNSHRIFVVNDFD